MFDDGEWKYRLGCMCVMLVILAIVIPNLPTAEEKEAENDRLRISQLIDTINRNAARAVEHRGPDGAKESEAQQLARILTEARDLRMGIQGPAESGNPRMGIQGPAVNDLGQPCCCVPCDHGSITPDQGAPSA